MVRNQERDQRQHRIVGRGDSGCGANLGGGACGADGISYEFFNYYFTLVLTPMFMLCGVFYPLQSLPDALQSLVQLLPLSYAVALVRPLVTGQELSAVVLHITVPATYAAVGYYVSVVLVRRRLIV
ncbi:MAG: ABC transporter permease [Gammaproteobacteria bacterium]|nr:ABC transporter permease [Gammaproteobacteria bacterium]